MMSAAQGVRRPPPRRWEIQRDADCEKAIDTVGDIDGSCLRPAHPGVLYSGTLPGVLCMMRDRRALVVIPSADARRRERPLGQPLFRRLGRTGPWPVTPKTRKLARSPVPMMQQRQRTDASFPPRSKAVRIRTGLPPSTQTGSPVSCSDEKAVLRPGSRSTQQTGRSIGFQVQRRASISLVSALAREPAGALRAV